MRRIWRSRCAWSGGVPEGGRREEERRGEGGGMEGGREVRWDAVVAVRPP